MLPFEVQTVTVALPASCCFPGEARLRVEGLGGLGRGQGFWGVVPGLGLRVLFQLADVGLVKHILEMASRAD